MKKYSMDIFDYEHSLKEDFPCLFYDIAVFCDCLKSILPVPIPKYLSKFSEKVDSYSQQIKRTKPKDFPNGFRVYIVDYRLNLLFACLDETGKIATFFSKYGVRAHDIEDYYYGDGELIGDTLPGIPYDTGEMLNFLNEYGFLPVEEMAFSSALVYEKETLVERRMLSQYQVSLLMEKFQSKNLINWKKNIANAQTEFFF